MIKFKYRIERGNLTDEEWDQAQKDVINLAARRGCLIEKIVKDEKREKISDTGA
mgnify:CR=1 FL=1